MHTPLILPICTVQPDFEMSIRDINDGLIPENKFWVSCYKAGEESVHGEVHVALNERDRNVVDFDGRKGVAFKAAAEPNSYFAACEERAIPSTRITVPEKMFSDPLPQTSKDVYQKISAFDVAPDGSQFATGYDDGSVYIIPTSSSVSHSLARKIHLSSITSLRFFPSSRVLLTSGADFSLSILPAELSAPSSPSSKPVRISPVRTLKGHTRAVTSTSIIARGRTVLSSSKDATLRLWDVSSGTQIRMMGTKSFTPVNAISTGVKAESVFSPPPDGASSPLPATMDPREVETSDKVVYCALGNGSFEAFDLGTKLSVYHSPSVPYGSLESIDYSPTHSLLATGSLNGVVTVYDTRSLTAPLVRFKRNGASVEDLAFVAFPTSGNPGDVALAIATSDGLPYVANVRPEGVSVKAELIGTDCDGVRCVKTGEDGAVWTAGDDGIVRRYGGLSI